jgi:hypothetical protein
MRNLYTNMLLDIAVQNQYAALGGNVVSPSLSISITKVTEEAERDNAAFFTQILPAFGRLIDAYLTTGDDAQTIESGCPLPFIWELWLEFRRTEDPTVLRSVRQLTYVFYKYETPYAPDTAQAVLDTFVANEIALKALTIDGRDPIIRRARNLISSVLSNLDPRGITPRHGPGAVATGEDVLGKTRFSRIYRELDVVYPFTGYMMFSLSHVADCLEYVQGLEVLDAGTAKVVLVSKDSRGPRLISCEPLEYQWIQQGLAKAITSRIEAHPLTRGHVNFADQGVNRELARKGSLTLEWDTLDMKDASDLVSLALVKELFSGTAVLEGLIASRTPETKLPNGLVVQMAKFAPMGSALCFPIEALVFYALAVSVLNCRGLSRRKAIDSVYVYGDDLVIRAGFAEHLYKAFEAVGLRFNRSKCATSKVPFRESCGLDAFKGHPVTPLRVKTPVSERLSPAGIASYVAMSNGFYEHGFYLVADYIERLVSRQIVLPYSTVLKGYLSWVRPYASRSFNIALGFRYRFNRRWFREEIKTNYLSPVQVSQPADNWETVLRKLNSGDTRSQPGTYSVPRRAKLSRGWVEA